MKIIIKGDPIAKTRHRCGCRGRKPISYDPQIKEKMQPVKDEIAMQWIRAFQSDDKETVLKASELTKVKSFRVDYTFVFAPNKSDTAAERSMKLWNIVPHNTKPDRDNLEKFYSDCCTGIIWGDDCQVTLGTNLKMYGEEPQTIMEIMPNPPLNLHPKVIGILSTIPPETMKKMCRRISSMAWECGDLSLENLSEYTVQEQEMIYTGLCEHLLKLSEFSEELKKIKKFSGLEEDLRKIGSV